LPLGGSARDTLARGIDQLPGIEPSTRVDLEAGKFAVSDGGGLQLAGAHWSRAADRVGIAYVLHGLSSDHRAYLAAGGQGFLLGDGRLRYGPEGIFEAYYRAQLGPYVEVGPDVQWIHNPGYNQDRGPAAVASLRLNVRYGWSARAAGFW
jgi:carbohydrate-selective porin OprB